MAVINSIRKRSGLLIGTIGVAMVLFVGGDLLSGNTNLLNKQDTTVGVIDGDKVEYAEFESMVQSLSGDQTLSQQQLEGVRIQAWNKFIQQKVLFKEYKALGLSVAPEELFDQIKNNPNNAVLKQYFTNPQTGQIYEQFVNPQTGRLDNNKVLLYIKNVMQSDQKESWLPIEEAISLGSISNKYTTLIGEGIHGTSLDAKIKNAEDNQKINLTWAGMSYNEIPDEDVTVDESDLKSYYSAHKNEKEYKQEETMRGAKVAIFTVEPSQKDFEYTLSEMNETKAEFTSIDNDTLFVFQNSDEPRTAFQLLAELEIPVEVDSSFFGSEVGTVYGPYLQNGSYVLTKKTGTRSVSDSVRARHILLPLKPESDTAATQALVDSIKTELNKKADFAAMATEYSEDFGSAQKGGDLDWFTQGRMVPEFNDICFSNETKVGDIVSVTTQFGIHIIEVTDRTKDIEKIEVANVSRTVEPSNETYDNVYNKASAFSINNDNLEKFSAALEEDKTIENFDYTTIKEGDKTLGSVENPRTVIRWIYDNNIGDVSEPFEIGNQFVISAITNIKEEGILPLSEVEDLVRTKVINEKKSEIILGKLGSFSTIEEAASNIGKEFQSANQISFNMFSVAGIGPESKVMGILFGLPQGQISEAIVGENGVYVVRVDEITEVPEATDLTFIQDEMARSFESRIDVEVFEALKENAGIVDNRSKFY